MFFWGTGVWQYGLEIGIFCLGSQTWSCCAANLGVWLWQPNMLHGSLCKAHPAVFLAGVIFWASMTDKKETARGADERRREAQIRQASAELMYLGCLLFRMLINQASIWIHRPTVRQAGTKSNTNTPEATSDIGSCLSAAACEEKVKDNQHNRNHFYSTVAVQKSGVKCQ